LYFVLTLCPPKNVADVKPIRAATRGLSTAQKRTGVI
jgi:hypothetical protein